MGSHRTSLAFTSPAFVSLAFVSLAIVSLAFVSLAFVLLAFVSLAFVSLAFVSLAFVLPIPFFAQGIVAFPHRFFTCALLAVALLEFPTKSRVDPPPKVHAFFHAPPSVGDWI